MKTLALTLAALATLAACGNRNDMGTAPMATQQPTVIMAEPTMNKL